MEYVIYKIVNEINGKEYIGRSQEINKRLRSHLNQLRRNTHNNLLLQNDWNKYGEIAFSFNVIDVFNNLDDVMSKEIELINSKASDSLYNIVKDSSVGGDTFTNNPRKEATRKLKSINSKGQNNPMYGVPKTEKMINSVKKANSVAVIIEGVEYESISQASRVLKLGHTTIGYRLNAKSSKYSEWNYK